MNVFHVNAVTVGLPISGLALSAVAFFGAPRRPRGPVLDERTIIKPVVVADDATIGIVPLAELRAAAPTKRGRKRRRQTMPFLSLSKRAAAAVEQSRVEDAAVVLEPAAATTEAESAPVNDFRVEPIAREEVLPVAAAPEYEEPVVFRVAAEDVPAVQHREVVTEAAHAAVEETTRVIEGDERHQEVREAVNEAALALASVTIPMTAADESAPEEPEVVEEMPPPQVVEYGAPGAFGERVSVFGKLRGVFSGLFASRRAPVAQVEDALPVTIDDEEEAPAFDLSTGALVDETQPSVVEPVGERESFSLGLADRDGVLDLRTSDESASAVSAQSEPEWWTKRFGEGFARIGEDQRLALVRSLGLMDVDEVVDHVRDGLGNEEAETVRVALVELANDLRIIAVADDMVVCLRSPFPRERAASVAALVSFGRCSDVFVVLADEDDGVAMFTAVSLASVVGADVVSEEATSRCTPERISTIDAALALM